MLPHAASPATESGQGVQLTAAQAEALRAFQQRLGPGHGEAPARSALRFLRARKWDVSAAVAQYQAAQQWRRQHNVDAFRRGALGPIGPEAARAASADPRLSCGGVEIAALLRLSAPLEQEWRYIFTGQTFLMGFDRQGRPISLQRADVAGRRFDLLYKLAGEGGGDPVQHIIDGYVRYQEVQEARMQESSALLGRQVTEQVVIMDLKTMAFWPDPRAILVFKSFLEVGQRYYPETLGVQFFVNAPLIFLGLWRMIRSWLDPKTAEKFHVLGRDFKPKLLEYIDASQLPREYGGTNDFELLRSTHTEEDYRRLCEGWLRAAEELPGRKAADRPTADEDAAAAPSPAKTRSLAARLDEIPMPFLIIAVCIGWILVALPLVRGEGPAPAGRFW